MDISADTINDDWYNDSHLYRVVRKKIRSEKCSEEYLKKVILYMDIKDIYRNQILSDEFILNFILNKDYHSSVEDSYITYDDVIYAQNKLKIKLSNNKKSN